MKLAKIIKKHKNLPNKKEIEKRTCNPIDGQKVLYNIIYDNKIKNAIEIGTFKGCTSLYLAAACEENGGKLYTINKNKKELMVAKQVVAQCDVKNIEFIYGDSIKVLPKLVKQIEYQFVFIDGFHSYENSFSEYKIVKKEIKNPGIIVLDDAKFIHPDGSEDGGVPKTCDEIEATIYDKWNFAIKSIEEIKPLRIWNVWL